jgi:hypothetical protein
MRGDVIHVAPGASETVPGDYRFAAFSPLDVVKLPLAANGVA